MQGPSLRMTKNASPPSPPPPGDTVKHVFSGHSIIDKTKSLMANGILMKVKSIAECSHGAFCNTFDLY